jgi:hypothetical protein
MFNKFRRIAYLYSRCGWRGVIAATRAKVTGEQVRVVVRPPEVKEPIYLRVPSSDLDTFEQVFRNGEYDFRALNPGLIVDGMESRREPVLVAEWRHGAIEVVVRHNASARRHG